MAKKKVPSPPPKEVDIPDWDNLKSQIYTVIASVNATIDSRQLRDDIRLVLFF